MRKYFTGTALLTTLVFFFFFAFLFLQCMETYVVQASFSMHTRAYYKAKTMAQMVLFMNQENAKQLPEKGTVSFNEGKVDYQKKAEKLTFNVYIQDKVYQLDEDNL